MLSKEELKRYNRHLILSEVGMEGQEKLKKARVLVIGAGGLGCPILQYLAAAGVGKLGLIDDDTIEESNLQRQVLFNYDDIGKSKAKIAAHKISLLNPHIEIHGYEKRLTRDNVLEIFEDFDIIVDGTDNFPTRYLVNDACVMLDKILVFGSIFKFEGQVTVFNYKTNGKRGPTLRCLFPEPPAAEDVPNCSQIGVLGVLPGFIGTLQANEVIKIILGLGDVLSGKMLISNLLNSSFDAFTFGANEENFAITELVDYDFFCNPESAKFDTENRTSISATELKDLLDRNADIILLDVREDFEREICHLPGLHIPMNHIPNHIDALPKDKSIVIYCHLGMRSAHIQKYLLENYAIDNTLNLEGGIHAWAEEVDEEMERY
jgi:molybdopterin/thiamine biosynthesis adenylyltransferase/rhodanese-related sulfurtransferase